MTFSINNKPVTLQDLAEYSLPAAQQHIVQRLLFTEPRPAHRNDVSRYFGPYRMPGTAPVGLRKSRPEAFQDTLADPLESYPSWLERTITRLLPDINACEPGASKRSNRRIDCRRTVQRVSRLLEWPTEEGVPFHLAIPQQMYEDVFVRILASLAGKTGAAAEPHRYRSFNAVCRRLGSMLLAMIDEGDAGTRGPDGMAHISRMAVLSGYVGINLKSSASAASTLLNRNRLPLDARWVADRNAAHAVSETALADVARELAALTASADGQFGIDSLTDYHAEVIDADEPTLLVFFADDYLESILDLKRLERIVGCNPQLKLLFVPRAGRYGNDLAFEDMASLMRLPAFKQWRQLRATGRVLTSAHGPRAGCLDPREISTGLIEQIDKLSYGRRVIFETKGCRNFEMLQGGLPVAWYAAFNCNRALSVRTVQVEGRPVFVRIPPYLKAYDGFLTPRIGRSALYPGAGVRYAQMTTLDLIQALKRPIYRHLLNRCGDEKRLNRALAAAAERDRKCVSVLLDDIASGQVAVETELGDLATRRPILLSSRRPVSGSPGASAVPPPTFRNVTMRRLAMDFYQFLRSQQWVVQRVGRQYSRSRHLVELDITYRCNLKCANCNRSCSQAPSSQEMPPAQVEAFIRDSIAAGASWKRVRLLGGEPTLHSRFETIVELLRAYKRDFLPNMRIVVCSNGFGPRVRRVLNRLPADVDVKNTYKRMPESFFRPFNVAPIDLHRFRWSDFGGGCRIIAECGVGVTPMGYYPCAVAGGIDRIFGLNMGRQKLPPPEDDMRDLMRSFCPLCGHFGFAWPTRRVRMSPIWQTAYRRYHQACR